MEEKGWSIEGIVVQKATEILCMSKEW